jgi:hypothetical protein
MFFGARSSLTTHIQGGPIMASKRIEVHLPDGLLLATFLISESGNGEVSEPKKEEPKAGSKGNGGKRDASLMSDAQKRYLFRLLADQGIENDAALEDLKNRFQVKSLLEVSKVDASREIEKLMTCEKGGGSHGH